ncbi:MAG: hypothetical protein QW750_08170, partial [Zestosphaera sp.]
QVFTTYSHCRQAQPTIKYQLLQAFKKPETAIFCSEEFWGSLRGGWLGGWIRRNVKAYEQSSAEKRCGLKPLFWGLLSPGTGRGSVVRKCF